MKKMYLALIFTCLLNYAYAQGIAGTWYGNLQVQGAVLPLVFHVTQAGDGYSATMDSPNQGARGLKASNTTFANNQLVIEAAQFGMKYTGTYLPDSNKVNGTFSQGGIQLPLVLTSKAVSAVLPARPQDPKSYPYKQQEITFHNTKANIRLAGTLTLPATGKFSKVVVLLSGSGPQNRNEEVEQFNHRPFLVWSDWLTRQGIAVLRYDDRGVGQSAGNYNTATSADFADDAEAAVKYLQARPDMKGVSIGLLGHSEGGLLAPMVASRNKAVGFLVLLAAPGVPVTQLMSRQTADQVRISGASEQVANLSIATNQKLYAAVKANTQLTQSQLEAKLTTLLTQEYAQYPAGSLGNANLTNLIQTAVKQASSPWFRYFITMDPAPFLLKTQCPVLALNGTLDLQVNSEDNLAGIRNSLQNAGNKSHQEVELSGLNHLFQQAQSGSVTEYMQIEETVNPVALQKVTDWINTLP
jgi:uncharacterized protein